MKLNKYRIKCTTDNKYEYQWSDVEPTICPVDTGHTIDGDQTTIIESLSGTPKQDTDGVQLTAPAPRLGSSKTLITHNFCNPSTWYEQSVRHDGGDGYGQILSEIDAYATYKSPDGYTNFIDTKHGKITNEHVLDSTYGVVVTVDGYAKTEDTDYTVNYQDGYVMFDPALTSSNEVRATFSYANGSRFTIAPSTNKVLRILYTEAQFSINADIVSPVQFQVWVYNPYDLPNKVPYGAADIYKNGYDFANVGNGGTYIPAFAGIEEDIVVVPFNYATVRDLSSASGVEIRISIIDDIPIDGYMGTLTAYCLSENE